MIPRRAIKVRVGSKGTKADTPQPLTHTLTLFGLLEVRFGHPLLSASRWLIFLFSLFTFYKQCSPHTFMIPGELFSSICCLPIVQVQVFEGLILHLGVVNTPPPTPPLLFFFLVPYNNTFTNPAVICDSPRRAAAVRAADSQSCVNLKKPICRHHFLPHLSSPVARIQLSTSPSIREAAAAHICSP